MSKPTNKTEGRQHPSITIAPGGPYLVQGVALLDADGHPVSTEPNAALCRCGRSSRKPFCDGAHAAAGFTGEPRRQFPAKRDYGGDELTVSYNRALCAHVGYCTARLGSVFDVQARPWIQPDQAPAAEVLAAVAACPSGALSTATTSPPDEGTGEPTIRLLRNGPLSVSGHVELADAPEVDGANRGHYTLCRCGGSKSMPFCDGTHVTIRFRDDDGS